MIPPIHGRHLIKRFKCFSIPDIKIIDIVLCGIPSKSNTLCHLFIIRIWNFWCCLINNISHLSIICSGLILWMATQEEFSFYFEVHLVASWNVAIYPDEDKILRIKISWAAKSLWTSEQCVTIFLATCHHGYFKSKQSTTGLCLFSNMSVWPT